MSLGFLNRCVFLPGAGTTADFVVSSAVTGFLTPADAGAVDGRTYHYFAQSDDLSEWEVGTGTYDEGTTTLSRGEIEFSSNANAKVAFSAAPKVHMGGAMAQDIAPPKITVTQTGGAPIILTPVPSVAIQIGNNDPVLFSGKCLSNISIFSDSLITAIAMDVEAVGGEMDVESNDVLTSINLSALTTVGGDTFINDNDVLTSINLSALTTVGGDTFIENNDVLTSINLSALTTVGGDTFIDGNDVLTSINLSALTTVGGDTFIDGNALDQTSVDAILVRLAAMDGTDGTTSYDGNNIDLSGGTNAAPSATGEAAIETLTGRGNDVTTN